MDEGRGRRHGQTRTGWTWSPENPLQPPAGRGKGSCPGPIPASVGQAAPGVPWGWAGSVVLEERQQVIVAVRGEVRRAQVGQQLIRVGQFWEQLRTTKQTGLGPASPLRGHPAPKSQPDPGLGWDVERPFSPQAWRLSPCLQGERSLQRQLRDQESLMPSCPKVNTGHAAPSSSGLLGHRKHKTVRTPLCQQGNAEGGTPVPRIFCFRQKSSC